MRRDRPGAAVANADLPLRQTRQPKGAKRHNARSTPAARGATPRPPAPDPDGTRPRAAAGLRGYVTQHREPGRYVRPREGSGAAVPNYCRSQIATPRESCVRCERRGLSSVVDLSLETRHRAQTRQRSEHVVSAFTFQIEIRFTGPVVHTGAFRVDNKFALHRASQKWPICESAIN